MRQWTGEACCHDVYCFIEEFAPLHFVFITRLARDIHFIDCDDILLKSDEAILHDRNMLHSGFCDKEIWQVCQKSKMHFLKN